MLLVSRCTLITAACVLAFVPFLLATAASPLAPKFSKHPKDQAVIQAGGGYGEPLFISDPGVYADQEGLHLFVSNIFCDRNGSWYYSWNPFNESSCNVDNATFTLSYAFSADRGMTWEFASGPVISSGPDAWDAVAIETAFPRVINDTLYVFYSARGRMADGYPFTSRYQIGVGTLALKNRTLREAFIRDGASCAKRSQPLVAHNTKVNGAVDNNVQEPSVIWTGKRWELYGIGLGLSKASQPIGIPGQKITGIYTLRWVFEGPDLVDGAGVMTVCNTSLPVNIIEVHTKRSLLRPSSSSSSAEEDTTKDEGYVMFFTTLVTNGTDEFHHHEAIGWGESSDGLNWRMAKDPILIASYNNKTAPFDDWGIMAPTVAALPPQQSTAEGSSSSSSATVDLVLFYSGWQLQNWKCLPVQPGGRFGIKLSGDRCILSNIGRAVSLNYTGLQ